jgi:type IV secretion system protein VirB11
MTPTTDPRILSLVAHIGPAIMNKLNDPNVMEIILNPDGNLWVEEFGSSMKVFGTMSVTQASLVLKTIAGFHNTIVNADKPILECELPIDGSRFEGLIPPITAAPAFTIRKKAVKIFKLSEYVESHTLSQPQYNALLSAIADHKNILIVGGTGSGKTTFANALIDGMVSHDKDERIVMIEDTNELQCIAPNFVALRANATTTMNQLLRATLRLRPDRILVGEVRGGEALSLLKAWNTGHPGGVATIHADSAVMGLSRLEDCISEATATLNKTLIANAINVIVFIKKTREGRRIEEIIEVTGFEAGKYHTQPI